MSACDVGRADELDGLIHGELPEPVAAALRAHADGCAACARELRYLQAERAALKGRPEPAGRVVRLQKGRGAVGLQAVRARAAQLQKRDRAAARRSLVFAALGAAAAMLMAFRGASDAPAATEPLVDGEALSVAMPWCGEGPDAIRDTETAFSACLSATPRALPGSPAACL